MNADTATATTATVPRGARSALHAACGALATAVRWLVIALALVMLAALAGQVFMRYVFDRAPSWTEEFAITCFGWSMLLAIALGVRDGIHVRMDLLVELLPPAVQRVIERLMLLLIAGCGGFLVWAGVRYAGDTAGAVSAAIGYPLTWLYASAPVSGALVCLFALERVAGYRPPESEPLSAT
ncbi:TRAP transporter small permease [Hydrogenophaga sp. BPS33]|uniref:TRAP transporter small permease n=1 Tax=Hydrogenophaga sp. BPS33 TaxID=2651974 RepID=UPI00131FB534|nr:TRAP transporter small permease [Hydrogenophaga sp. BPS33]QHE83466.1 TRAP transporter small permease [Hydrogenophaga sp. BPS33]